MPLFFLWGYVKDQVFTQSANMLDELKLWTTSAIAVLKSMFKVHLPRDVL
jgi:hypothetical protein